MHNIITFVWLSYLILLLLLNHYVSSFSIFFQGDTLETGHYTAACKNPYDHQWYKFDDQKVSQVPADNIPDDIVNNEAYILFYQRRKTDAMESSGSSSASGDHWVSKITVAPDLTAPAAAASSSIPRPSIVGPLNTNEKDKMLPPKIPNLVVENLEFPKANDISDLPAVEVHVKNEPLLIKEDTARGELLKIQKTNEDEFVDVEILDLFEEAPLSPQDSQTADVIPIACEQPVIAANSSGLVEPTIAEPQDLVEIRQHNTDIKAIHENISSSVPSERSIWPIEGHRVGTVNRSSLNLSDVLSKNFLNDHRRSDYNIRHSVSSSITAAMRQQKDTNDTFAMIRGVSSCSKDTVMFMDQPVHSFMSDDNSFLGSHSLWVCVFCGVLFTFALQF